jgi:hypothetical protein
VGGAAIGELIILTQPTATIEDLRSYRAGRLDGAAERALGLAYSTTF